jgi:hypothetical protein
MSKLKNNFFKIIKKTKNKPFLLFIQSINKKLFVFDKNLLDEYQQVKEESKYWSPYLHILITSKFINKIDFSVIKDLSCSEKLSDILSKSINIDGKNIFINNECKKLSELLDNNKLL